MASRSINVPVDCLRRTFVARRFFSFFPPPPLSPVPLREFKTPTYPWRIVNIRVPARRAASPHSLPDVTPIAYEYKSRRAFQTTLGLSLFERAALHRFSKCAVEFNPGEPSARAGSEGPINFVWSLIPLFPRRSSLIVIYAAFARRTSRVFASSRAM